MRLIDRIFRKEEINGKNRCPTYLYRWTLFATRWFSVYLHHFVGDDWSRDMHDHPKRFISIGLAGKYIEETPGGEPEGTWEVVADKDGEMYRLRWSVADDDGAHLYVRHYPGSSWGKSACESEARTFNREGRLPWEWDCYRPRTQTVERTYRAPWVRTFPANHIHRLKMIDGGDCWTLVIVLRAVRPWGFWHLGQWVPWKVYVGDAGIADRMKSCPD